MTPEQRIREALDIAIRWGQIDGAHHKAWTIDQMVRALTDCPKQIERFKDVNGKEYEAEQYGQSNEYKKFVADYEFGEDGPATYDWDTGVAP